jgi:hypothetical protein
MEKYSKKWWLKWLSAAGIRAIKTFAQAMITLIGSDYISIVDLNWVSILGISATMALLSLLTSIVGLPEIEEE